TYPASAHRMRAVFLDQVLAMVRRATGDAEDAEARAGLITSQVLGTARCRYVLALPPVVAMDAQALAAVLGPSAVAALPYRSAQRLKPPTATGPQPPEQRKRPRKQWWATGWRPEPVFRG